MGATAGDQSIFGPGGATQRTRAIGSAGNGGSRAVPDRGADARDTVANAIRADVQLQLLWTGDRNGVDGEYHQHELF